jgi:acyl-[acyl carrier protein]--UDP-N-acetylglucosamine O-acyltransferase
MGDKRKKVNKSAKRKIRKRFASMFTSQKSLSEAEPQTGS